MNEQREQCVKLLHEHFAPKRNACKTFQSANFRIFNKPIYLKSTYDYHSKREKFQERKQINMKYIKSEFP